MAISNERLKNIPKRPGVYLMKDQRGEVIYVGKAKSLRARVRSYFSHSDSRLNVQFLLKQVSEIETLVTIDERQALVLENDLIKKFKPRYNIRLKDDKAHLTVRIDLERKWPRLEVVRRVWDDGAKYIGPFAFAYELNAMLETIRRSIPLRTCSDKMIFNRVRPCLEYQLKRCSGPCCLPVNEGQYGEWLHQAISLLEGRNKEVVAQLELQMEKASEALLFEEAAELRDRIAIIKKFSAERPLVSIPSGATDVYGIYGEGAAFEVSLLQVRQGRLFSAKTFGFEEVEIPVDELLSSVLSQYYAREEEIPQEILVPFQLEDRELLEGLYSEKRGSKVEILIPKRGTKARLLRLALENAKENFTSRFKTNEKRENILRALCEEFLLEEPPRTIECVDISHFQGSATVASVVHFRDGLPDKSRYRHFRLKGQEGRADDFASMREVVQRHLSRCVEENTLCELVIIDGGRGQLAEALKVRKELGLLSPAIIALAKERLRGTSYLSLAELPRKPERIFIEGQERPVILNPRSDSYYLLTRIRDEAHRFAVEFHRKVRTRGAFRSSLDVIPGLGPKRKLALLRAFKSVQALKTASVEELSKAGKLPPSLAERVAKFLKNA